MPISKEKQALLLEQQSQTALQEDVASKGRPPGLKREANVEVP